MHYHTQLYCMSAHKTREFKTFHHNANKNNYKDFEVEITPCSKREIRNVERLLSGLPCS